MNAKPLMIAAVLFAVNAVSNAETKPAPPNILFFLTDDESWIERSAYGWSKLPTPAFDRVAREGALFAGMIHQPGAQAGAARARRLTGP